MTDSTADARTFGRSTIAIVVGDISAIPADAIVDAANSAFAAGGGVDGAIRAAAGPELSGEMRRRYPMGISTGTAVSTEAYNLPARWVIHAVGPVWAGAGRTSSTCCAGRIRECSSRPSVSAPGRSVRRRSARAVDGYAAEMEELSDEERARRGMTRHNIINHGTDNPGYECDCGGRPDVPGLVRPDPDDLPEWSWSGSTTPGPTATPSKTPLLDALRRAGVRGIPEDPSGPARR